jgi:hypothetical protein
VSLWAQKSTSDKAWFEYKIILKTGKSFVPLEILELAILVFVLPGVASAAQYLINMTESNVCR